MSAQLGSRVMSRERYGPVCALRLGRRLLRLWPPLMQVRCYAVDGLMIDAGLAPFHRELAAFAHDHAVRRAVVTHHHEDHSGGSYALRRAGVQVLAPPETCERMAAGVVIKPYEYLVWGRPPRVRLDVLGDSVETCHHRFTVIAAPGHADDQVVLYEPSEGWLFSADVYLGERVKAFRRDEDFAGTMTTLRRLCELDFDSLFCAHRPVPSGGRQALRRKLQYFEQLHGQVQLLAARGLGVRQIALQLLGREQLGIWGFTLGDASKVNLVRSILHGPRPRRRKPWFPGPLRRGPRAEKSLTRRHTGPGRRYESSG